MSGFKARLMGLLMIAGAFAAPPAMAEVLIKDTSPQREEFLRLLISRQDSATLQRLTAEKQRIDLELQRLQSEGAGSKKLAEVQRRDAVVTQQLANPPRPPAYNQLLRLRQQLLLQEQHVDNTIQSLNQIQPTNPRQAAQIDRALARMESRAEKIAGALLFIDRVVGTPTTPRVATNLFALLGG